MGTEPVADPEDRYAGILTLSHPESPGHKMTLPYAPAFGFTAINNFTGAQLVIRAHYRPDFLPWRKTETFPFQAVRAAGGTWIWKSIPR